MSGQPLSGVQTSECVCVRMCVCVCVCVCVCARNVKFHALMFCNGVTREGFWGMLRWIREGWYNCREVCRLQRLTLHIAVSPAGTAGESPARHHAAAERGSGQPQGCAQTPAAAGVGGEGTVQGHARAGRGFQGKQTSCSCLPVSELKSILLNGFTVHH